ncbi:hypothetical protein [Aliarcobacter butzleri]|uniref:hypothetical protein n=1 Tax=Aliarcobacter butzleri TaxID=28197 RepID=UPI002B23FA09|nr:hypothetical protein [Aliarcobacter butzleri]
MKLILILLVFSSSLFSCGCIDPFNASAGVESINESYVKLDNDLEKILSKQVEYLINMTNNTQVNKKISNNLVNFKIDSIVELNDYIFTLDKRKNILSIGK